MSALYRITRCVLNIFVVQATQGIHNNFNTAQQSRPLRQHQQDRIKAQHKKKGHRTDQRSHCQRDRKKNEHGTLAANKINQLVSEGIKEALLQAVTQPLAAWKS
jgi:hypothetical protein